MCTNSLPHFASAVFLGVFREVVCSAHMGVCVVSSAVSILHEDWCWKNKSLEVEVLEDDVPTVEFRQTGYMLRCSLSHAITLVSRLLRRPHLEGRSPFGEREGRVCQGDRQHSQARFPFLPLSSPAYYGNTVRKHFKSLNGKMPLLGRVPCPGSTLKRTLTSDLGKPLT